MKQQSFFKPSRKEHGGILSFGSRRSRRPLTTKHPLHLTLRSDYAYGSRSLLKHRSLINHVGRKFSSRFGVRIYRQAICGNHLHLIVRGTTREGLQNFFRVFAGHIAQQILGTAPISELERSKFGGGAPSFEAEPHAKKRKQHSESARGCKKNQRKFWALLLYTRVMTWGKEFNIVSMYILRNNLEALRLIAYQPRKRNKKYNLYIDTAWVVAVYLLLGSLVKVQLGY